MSLLKTPKAKQILEFLPHSEFLSRDRTRAAIFGRINAPDAKTAVKEWIEKFGITDPEQQERLVARLVARPVK